MRADAEPVFRCAYRLEQVAEDVRTAAARTAGAYPEDWRGSAGIAYQQRLDATADRVRRMAAAYDAAGAALMPYARTLLDVAALEQRVESLRVRAAEADRHPPLVGPSPGEGLRAAAAQLQAEAEDLERRAAAVCAAALHDEASRAPSATAWQRADRIAGDLMQYGAQTVAGTASLVGSAWRALPGVGNGHSRDEARHELAEAALAAAQIWKIPIDIRHDLEDGRPGAALAELAGVVGPGRLSKFDRLGPLVIRDPVLAYKEAVREQELAALLANRVIVRPGAEALASGHVSLTNEELRGGHTLREHVRASRMYLSHRTRRGPGVASTFPDVATAEHAVATVLEGRAEEISALYRSRPGSRVRLTGTVEDCLGRMVMRGSRRTHPASRVLVVLQLEGGEPHVLTAFPIS